MSLDMEQIAAAFCSHRFSETYPYMADEIKWNMIGREELIGCEAVIGQCDQAVEYLKTVTSTITKLKIIRAENNIIVLEGGAQFQDQQNQILAVVSCDIFQFSSDKRLVEITSYVVDLPTP